MPFEVVKTDPEWTLTLSGVADVFDAAALHVAAIEVATATPTGVLVKLAAVESIDTSVTQLLLGFRRALSGAGKTLRLEGAPPSVRERWRSAGLTDELA